MWKRTALADASVTYNEHLQLGLHGRALSKRHLRRLLHRVTDVLVLLGARGYEHNIEFLRLGLRCNED